MKPIKSLLQDTGLWRASSIDCEYREGLPTGFNQLDSQLPGNGWPPDGVTELLCQHEGIGEIRLLAPGLAKLSQQQSRWLLWVCPPNIPYAPALASAGFDLTSLVIVRPDNRADMLWVLEKALSSSSCSAVLAWPGNIKDKELRRLQVASKEGNCWNILFRPATASRQSSPAELRIELSPAIPSPIDVRTGINLKILKRKGGWTSDAFTVWFDDKLNQATPYFPDLQRSLHRTYPAKPDDSYHDIFERADASGDKIKLQ